MDEPSITNPLPYHNIRKHDSVEIIYGNKLVEDGVISKEQMEDVMDKVQKKCVLLKTKLINQIKWIIQIWKDLSHCKNLYKVIKDFSVDHLKEINDAMLTYPEISMYLKAK